MRQIKLRAILSGILMAAVLLSVAGAASAAQPPKALALPGEIILQVPPGTASATVDALAATAGCDVIKPLAYSPGVYLIGVKGRQISLTATEPSNAMLVAMAQLRTTPGVTADPNFIRYFTGFSQKSPRVTRATAGPGWGRYRATRCCRRVVCAIRLTFTRCWQTDSFCRLLHYI